MYKHTQTGRVTIAVLVGTGVLLAFLPAFPPAFSAASPVRWAVVVVMIATAFGFGTLTTEVDHDRFSFWFGPGVWRRSFPLAEIRSCAAVTNPWWWGHGIHWTPAGWLYNVAGCGAVELTLADGRTLRVGSDEPDQLCRMISAMKGTT